MIRTHTSESVSTRLPLLWLRQLPRWFVGSILLSTGIGKLLDLPGFAAVLANYDLLPASINVLLAYTLPFVELGAAVCLLSRLRLRAAGWVAVGLHVMLLSSVLITLWRGLLLANCGCFGVFLARPLTRGTAIEDAVMLVMSLLVVWNARPRA